MADIELKQGDTWPPLKGSVQKEDGTPETTHGGAADKIIVIIDGPVHIEKIATALDYATNNGDNWQITWSATDLDTIGEYNIEVEVTWDDASTPPKIQTYPHTGFMTMQISADLGGDGS